MKSASERHDIKSYFLTKDQKSVIGDFSVSVVYDFFRTVFRAQHAFCFPFQKYSLKTKEFEYALLFLYYRV